MGCDIHTVAEKKVGERYVAINGFEPFDWRNYFMFGFLAGVRNYSGITPISNRRGVPEDASSEAAGSITGWDIDGHSHSWLTVTELMSFDYDASVEDRRYTGMDPRGFMSGALTADPGNGEITTWREALGQAFFDDLKRLEAEGADRVVFWFDN